MIGTAWLAYMPIWGFAYESLGWYVEALNCYEQDLNWHRKRVGDPQFHDLQAATALNNVGVAQTRLGQYLEANQAFNEALAFLARCGDDQEIKLDRARTLMNQALMEMIRQLSSKTVEETFLRSKQAKAALLSDVAQLQLAQLDLYEASWYLSIAQGHLVDEHAIYDIEQKAPRYFIGARCFRAFTHRRRKVPLLSIARAFKNGIDGGGFAVNCAHERSGGCA